MSTKSDFAQKLLHDLRLRKERVAAAQNSSYSHSMSRDGHANPGQIYKGSRQTKTLESVNSKVGNLGSRSSTSNRSFRIEESSGQIVPYATGRVQNSEKVGDLSMALAFAIENGGKFTKMDSSSRNPVLTFLHQFGQRSMDISKMERRTSIDKYQAPNSQFPSVSHVHINEVSKGIQKLNQILRACSNGLNFDKNSVEVGTELLKGAMDLEESLRMLVNLQEASDHMIKPQSKSRITLLDEDEEGDNSIVKIGDQKQVERPRFSFDKPSKNSYITKETTKNDIKQRLMALTYPDETPKLHEKQPLGPKKLVAHIRSASCAPDFKNLDQKNQSSGTKAGSEKGRISNVIAKLMGLDELPAKEDNKASRKGSDSKKKQEPVLKKTAGPIGTPDAENRSSLSVDKNMIQRSNMLPVQEAKFALKAEYVRASPSRSNDMVSSGRVKQQEERSIAVNKDTGSLSSGLPMTNNMMDKQQSKNIQVNQVPGDQVNFQQKQKEQNQTSVKEKITKTVEIKEPILKSDSQPKMPQTSRVPPIDIVLQELTDCKVDKIWAEKKETDRYLKKSEGQDEKHQAGKKEKLLSNKTVQARKHKANQVETITLPKPRNRSASLKKKQSSMNQATLGTKNSTKSKNGTPSKDFSYGIKQVALAKNRSSSTSIVIMQSSKNKKADQNALSNEVSSREEKLTIITQSSKQEKPINLLLTERKGCHTEIHRNETSPKIEELSATLQGMKLQKDDKSCYSGEEQLTESLSREANVDNRRSDELDVSMEILNLQTELHSETENSTSCNAIMEKECDYLIGSETVISNENHQDKTLEVLEISLDQNHGEDMPKISEAIDQLNGIHQEVSQNSKLFNDEKNRSFSAKLTEGGGTGISKLVRNDQETTLRLVSQEPLTEPEKHFKESVIKSQQFLNTAEALFKLNIPISILHASDQNNQGEDVKLMLDCGYEIMKRKARRQELALHPYATMSIGYVKTRSLDDLIKQLCKDFDTLKFYGGDGNMSDECDAADYLHNMIGQDMHNRIPDVNSMWDFGWSEQIMFAFFEKDDVIKDVEKHLLNGLIDEITMDLLRIAISV
ncbi:PREDICTED: uncharacterized protein LOC109224900 [Nicotiana attenuata]|uniref:DUF3741 domain-containing protein n=1 Tax=Nicotiana attenuata TaxID=49451 RepID=A0A1J6J2E0_NICAT|nr:PREDICTED: uncharacterized protein LOC109224900 [Nicotiana attenuata]OIT04063.1 hypothetical protein A4A49_13668 [Nicotiana attenuata]